MNFRESIDKLKEENIIEIYNKKIHWKHEIGEYYRQKLSPILFTNVIDYPSQNVFVGAFSNLKSINGILGYPIDTPRKQLLSSLKKKFKQPQKSIILDSIVDSRKLITKNINVYSLPVPWWHPIDNERYIGTWHLNISKNLFTDTINVGVYRMQILDATSCTVSASPNSHLSKHIAIAETMGKNLEMTIAIGVPEGIIMAAGGGFPIETNEFDAASVFCSKPVLLNRCISNSLVFPSEAEIVLEGEIENKKRVKDGPYFDYTGVSSTNPAAYQFNIKAVHTKENLIFRGTSIGLPGAEDHQMFSILAGLNLVNFHGSFFKRKLQNYLLNKEKYKLFQIVSKSLKRAL